MSRTTSAPRSTGTRPEPPSDTTERSANAPVFTTRHRALKAAVWRNETENGPMYNTTITRSYKDGETWKESTSFGYDDVLIVAELLRTCHGFICREMSRQSEQGRE